MFKLKRWPVVQQPVEQERVTTFLDMIAPSTIKFYTDYFICGNTFRCVWALREYPASTTEQTLLRYLAEKDGVNLHIYTRQVTPVEEGKIINNATKMQRLRQSNTNDVRESVTAESNIKDVEQMIVMARKNKEPFVHCAVFLELLADSVDRLRQLQTEVLTELVRSKLNVDKLILRQQSGLKAVMPCGYNAFADQFERVLPASSVANLYPYSYSGKTDSRGFYIGKDKNGSNVIVDFDKRDNDKTNANILILGNSGQGKSYLLKLLLCNFRESGKTVLCLDPEMEYRTLAEELGGRFIDMMSGQYIINVLEPKVWTDGDAPGDDDDGTPTAFRCQTRLSQHISFLRDFFRAYKSFTDAQIDTIEIMLAKLYEKWGITDETDFSKLHPDDFPILSDLYELIEKEYQAYDAKKKPLYTAETLQEVCLALHALCVGAESKFFNGHTNIGQEQAKFVVFGVKGVLDASQNVRDALLFNLLAYCADKLLTAGNTVMSVDELYLFLSNLTALVYIRNFTKRVRKKESAVVLASQNLEDFNLPGVAEYTKPLFSIPTHSFLFNAGNIDSKFFTDNLQLEDNEYNLIKYPSKGSCLYRCGNERYHLQVTAPPHKQRLFGEAGGR